MYKRNICILALAATCCFTACKKDEGCKLDTECPDGQICRNMKCEAAPSADTPKADADAPKADADEGDKNADAKAETPTGTRELGLTAFEENKTVKLEDLGLDIDYVLKENLILEDGKKLEIGPGVTIDMQSSNAGVEVRGDAALMVNGTADKPVVFKSTIGSTWSGLVFNSKNKDNALNYLQILNADGEERVMRLDLDARLAMDHVTIDGSANDGIHVSADAKLTKFTNNTIKNCKGYPLVLDSYAIIAMIGDNNTYENNKPYIRINAYTFDNFQESVIKKQPIPFFIAEGMNVDGESGTLTIEPGTEFVFEHEREARIGGSIQLKLGGDAKNPVIMRGLNDEPNYWRGFYIDTERPSSIDGLTLSQTGYDEYASLRIRSDANISLANITFNATEHRCLEIGNSSKVAVKGELKFVKCDKGNIYDDRIEGEDDQKILTELPVTAQ